MTDRSWRSSHLLSNAADATKNETRKPQPQSRRVRNRRGKRSQRFQGTPLTVEFLDNEHVAATLLDESSTGFAIDVGDDTLFRPGQRVAVRRRGMLTAAVVRYVQPEAETYRVGLKMGRR